MGFDQFLEQYPSSLYAAEARSLREEALYKEASAARTIEALERYIANYPQSVRAMEVTALVRKLRFEAAKEDGTAMAYEGFLRRYPNGANSEELRNGLPAVRKWEVDKKLGDLLIGMAPSTYVMITLSGAPKVVRSQKVESKEQLAEFQQLLKDGADPSAVHIAGYAPGGEERTGDGFSRISPGSPGKAVPAAKGGMTLVEYCGAIGLKQIPGLLTSHAGD